MSDIESFNSGTQRNASERNADGRFDSRLDDHRNQPTSLPVPSDDQMQPYSFHPHSQTRQGYMRIQRRTSRSHSFGEGGLDPKDQRHLGVAAAANANTNTVNNSAAAALDPHPKNNPSIKRKKRDTRGIDNLEADLASPMMRHRTNETTHSDRRPSNSSIDSDANSHGSRSSQETEEDVCFPMLREHVRVNGIDFDEMDEFINEERDNARAMQVQQQLISDKVNNSTYPKPINKDSMTSAQSRHQSTASLKYTPKNILRRTATAIRTSKPSKKDNDDSSISPIIENNEKLQYNSRYTQHNSDSSTINEVDEGKGSPSTNEEFVTFNGYPSENTNNINNIDSNTPLPERFSFFSTKLEETIHSPDLPSLTEDNQSIREVFNNGEGTWWLDCSCPTDLEMKVLSKAFGLHPLTSEDIRVQESREKVELFKNYYFVCFHTFEPDKESEDYLEPINVYIVVFREGILSFHFSPVNHPANVRRRVRQLRDYVDVSADWICYAIIDDITDAFIPVITAIEYEADAIEDSVFVARETDFGTMLQRIGESRRKVMTLMRLLSGKADVIKMFAKRCQDEVYSASSQHPSQANLPSLSPNDTGGILHQHSPPPHAPGFSHDGTAGISFGPKPGAPPNMMASNQYQFHLPGNITQPRADIALYLGDIQDHVVTMFQNLLAYEKIFSRSHSNYLAQLQVESVNSNNKVTTMLSQVTLIGTLLLPLNLVTGLFGMNVTVPGQDTGELSWFFGILGVMLCIIFTFFMLARIWLRRLLNPEPAPSPPGFGRRSIRSLGLRKWSEPAKSVVSFPGYD